MTSISKLCNEDLNHLTFSIKYPRDYPNSKKISKNTLMLHHVFFTKFKVTYWIWNALGKSLFLLFSYLQGDLVYFNPFIYNVEKWPNILYF